MAAKTRLNITVSPQELSLLKSVVAPRKLSRFIVDAAIRHAVDVQRKTLREQIVLAYKEDSAFQTVGTEWDAVAHEGWPPA